MKNILKEIKNDITSIGSEPRVDNLEQYISQNKLFGILFFSNIVPDYLNLLSKLEEQINNSKNLLKLLICICEENEEEYNKISSEIKISCLLLKYDSKNRETLIKKYNIMTIPTLIVLDSYGEVVDILNKERIVNLNENDIIGWNNIFIVPYLYKNKLPELGDIARISNHPHELVFSNHSMKPGYGKGGWICDVCRKNFTYNVENFFCGECGFDVCDVCFDNYKC